jgi:hypothetical protein
MDLKRGGNTVKLMTMLSRTPVSQSWNPLASTGLEPPTEEYQKLAAKLGVFLKPASSLESVIQAEMIHVYPMAKVRKYLTRITPMGKVWVWKPLRDKDLARLRLRSSSIAIDNSPRHGGTFADSIYSRPVPYAALLSVEKIEQAMCGQEAKPAFFVSDYVAFNPDPFLMVTVPAMGESQWKDGDGSGRLWTANPEPSCFVIERWDEPSFR